MLTEEEGLRNVTYLQADAQLHRFPPRHFDLCISRFGVMFFDDPVAAFTNIGNALQPGARLVLMVWQDGDPNDWWAAIRQSLSADLAEPASPPSGPRMFSLADPATAAGILAAADFTEVGFTYVHEPVYYGPDTATARDFVPGFRDTKDLLADVDTATAQHAIERLRVILAEHDTGSGVFFDSRAWIITARR